MTPEAIFNYYIKNWKDKQTIKIPEHARVFKKNELIYYKKENNQQFSSILN